MYKKYNFENKIIFYWFIERPRPTTALLRYETFPTISRPEVPHMFLTKYQNHQYFKQKLLNYPGYSINCNSLRELTVFNDIYWITLLWPRIYRPKMRKFLHLRLFLFKGLLWVIIRFVTSHVSSGKTTWNILGTTKITAIRYEACAF